jgi:hypothetical protein
MSQKHFFYFTGYSDDVVIAGRDKRSLDEYYSSFYLLSNGLVIKAEHGTDGWVIAPASPPAEGATIIAAVDLEDEGKEHADARIPEWLDAPGHAPVCIIEWYEPLEIIATSDRRTGFPDNSPEFIQAAMFRKVVLKAADMEDSDEMPAIEAFKEAFAKFPKLQFPQ